MIKILITVCTVLLISSGIGIELVNRLNIKKLSYSAPLGFIALMFALQLSYYPTQFFNLSFDLIIITSFIILGIGLYFTIKNIKTIIKEVFTYNSIYVGCAFLVFFFVFYHVFIDLEYSDSPMYLNYIAQNIGIDELNKFHLYTGLTGEVWEGIYLFQGYYHFGSFLCWLINIPFYLFNSTSYVENIAISTYGLGMLYSLISSMFFVSMINSLNIKNVLLKNSSLIFVLLYSNFYYWRVVFSYYGNTWRTLCITMLVYFIYVWIKENKDDYRYILMLVLGAGYAFSSSFLFISFCVIFTLMVYLFTTKRKNAFVDLSLIVWPMVLYVTIMYTIGSVHLSILITIAATIYYVGLKKNFILPLVKCVEDFLFKYAKVLFYVIAPIALVGYSAYINVFDPEFLYNFEYWFQDHQEYDMVKDYRFVYANWIDNILNCIRWLGVIIILFDKKYKNTWFKAIVVVSLLLFLNPFVTTALAKTIASNVFYRTMEMLFNPFTETILILVIVDYFSENKVLINVLCALMIFITGISHYFSWTNNEDGLYTFYIKEEMNLIPFFKVTVEEYEIIKELQRVTADYDEPQQLRVISHAEGLRTFMPQVYQLFTARDYFYPHTRLDEMFYQIARKHHSWEEYPETKYELSCGYIYENDVDYVITKYWENPEFDTALNDCSTIIYESSVFKLREINK